MKAKASSKRGYATVSVESPKEKYKIPTAEALLSDNRGEEHGNTAENVVVEEWSRGEKQPAAYRDKRFSIIFLVHLLLIIIAVPFAPSAIRDVVRKNNLGINTEKRSEKRTASDRLLNITPLYSSERGERLLDETNSTQVFINTTTDVDSDESTTTAGIETAEEIDESLVYEEDIASLPEHYTYYTDEEVAIFKQALYFSIVVVTASLFISVALTVGALYLLEEQSQRVIKGSLIFIIGYFLLGGVAALIIPSVPLDNLSDEDQQMMEEANESGKVVFAAVDFILALAFACYAKAIWRDIPFAAANLKTGVTACKANLGVFAFAFATPLINLIIYILQFMALISALHFAGSFEFEENRSDVTNAATSIIIILFSLSAYWTAEITKNVSTVMVSGTVGTWWFSPIEASSFCSSAVMDSFKRATTYSFGSICFGSLLVAVLNVIIDSLKRSRSNRNCVMLFCVITCILQLLEGLAEYFNKWAFIYVGLYGYDYMTAGKSVVTLFKARGWTSIISDSLVNRALMMVATFIGLATGLLITGLWDLLEISDTDDEVVKIFSFVYFYAAFVIALMTANQLLSVVGAAADTAVVCFAEASAEFEENHPQLSMIMRETYAQAWPDVDFRRTEV